MPASAASSSTAVVQKRGDSAGSRGGSTMEIYNKAGEKVMPAAGGVVVVPNPFPMKPIPSKVLAEDDYTDAVSHIIERDFFPDLPHLRIKHELLQARENGDHALAQELQWQLINMSRPTPLSSAAGITPGRITPAATPLRGGADMSGAATPAGATPRLSAWERDDDVESTVALPADTPSNASLRLADGKEVVVDLQKVRLDDFHRVFTSEDNAAFEAIIKRDYDRKALKQWWIEDSELQHNTLQNTNNKAMLEGMDVDKGNGCLLGNEFKGRNALSFPPHGVAQLELEKPKVDFKNTRFTTAQQADLDNMLGVAVASRQAQMAGEHELDVGDRMARNGKFGIQAFQAQGGAGMRSIGGRISTPLMPSQEVRGYPMVATPTLLPGQGGLSPLMTYGKIGSTPRCLEEEGPVFKMNEASAREKAAERLQRGATQKLREAKQHNKSERLRALGLTPRGDATPGRTSRTTPGAASTGRRTPGSVSSKVSPLSPIGALIQRAQKLSQQGGRFGIAPSPALTPREEAHSRKRRRKSSSAAAGAGGENLPASITDDLL